MALAAENARILNEAEKEYLSTLEKIKKERLMLLDVGMGWEARKTSIAGILGDISKNQGWELYGEDGGLNIDAIETYYDSFKKRLTRKQRKLVEELIENGKAYGRCRSTTGQYLTDLFSGVADSIADNMDKCLYRKRQCCDRHGSDNVRMYPRIWLPTCLKTSCSRGCLIEYSEALKKVWDNTEIGSKESKRRKPLAS